MSTTISMLPSRQSAPAQSAVTAAAVGVPSTASQTLDAIQKHYSSGARTLFPLPTALLVPVRQGSALQNTGTVQANVDEPNLSRLRIQAIVSSYGDSIKEILNNQHTLLQAAMDELGQTGDLQAARDRLNQLEAQTDAQLIAANHEQFDQLGKALTDNPAMQAQILSIANSSGGFVSHLIDEAGAFIKGLVSQVVQWIAAALDWAVKAAEAAARWLADTVGDVERFVAGFF
jgi:hypothetical protein